MPQDASPAGRGVEQEAGRQTGAGTGPDRLREEILGAAGEAARRLAPALPEDLPVLLRHLFEALPTAELAAESPEALAAAAISLWSLASERRPAEAKLRLQPPGPGRGASTSPTDRTSGPPAPAATTARKGSVLVAVGGVVDRRVVGHVVVAVVEQYCGGKLFVLIAFRRAQQRRTLSASINWLSLFSLNGGGGGQLWCSTGRSRGWAAMAAAAVTAAADVEAAEEVEATEDRAGKG